MKECVFVRKCRFRLHDEKRLCAHVDSVKQKGSIVEKCPDELNCRDCSHMIRKGNGVIKKHDSYGIPYDIWLCYCRKGILLRESTKEPFIYRYYTANAIPPTRWKIADTCEFYEGDENG